MTRPARLALLVPALALPLAGCSSDPSKDDSGKGAETYLGLTQPENGFQVRSIGREVKAGEDVEYCEVAELPGDPSVTYYVNRLEFGNGERSHHLIVNAAEPGGAGEATLADLPIGHSVPCLATQSAYGDGFEFTGGVQVPYGEAKFPEGVGRVYHGGQRIVFDYHYYNTTEEPVAARSAVNFHLVEEEDVKHIARVVMFSNYTIDTPPGESRSFVGECHYNQDVLVQNVTRHTHRWGTDFKVWYAGGEKDGQEFWKSEHFEEDVDFPFEQPLLRRAGEGFRFQCDFRNTEKHALRFGPNATDEMCILFSTAWEAKDGEKLADQDCSIVQVDDAGVGRPLSADAEYRAPTADEIQACTEASTMEPSCTTCACGTCGGAIADCIADADCAVIFECVQRTGCSQADCASVCGEEINAHSSGAGKLITLGSCMGSSCSDVCTLSAPN
ncbi:MAG: hypothetical protein FJ104_09615 [Deltaproteobacteria bacterium]|nr:hypothetical protein [Deltaproteobacteria bacterium]